MDHPKASIHAVVDDVGRTVYFVSPIAVKIGRIFATCGTFDYRSRQSEGRGVFLFLASAVK